MGEHTNGKNNDTHLEAEEAGVEKETAPQKDILGGSSQLLSTTKEQDVRMMPTTFSSVGETGGVLIDADDISSEDNDSKCDTCQEGDGTTLVGCDGCVKSFHAECLPFVYRPSAATDGAWFCPECETNKKNKKADFFNKRRKTSFEEDMQDHRRKGGEEPTKEGEDLKLPRKGIIMSSLETPGNDLLSMEEQRRNSAATMSDKQETAEEEMGIVPVVQQQYSNRRRESVEERTELIVTEHDVASTTYKASGPDTAFLQTVSMTSSRSRLITSRGVTSSRSPSPVPPLCEESQKRKKRISEGSKNVSKINIGPGYQIPGMPVFFLNRDEYDPVYSASQDSARLVYSPNILDRIKQRRILEGKPDHVIKSETEMATFINKCAKNWKSQPGWQPFSPEFAYKILHHADYDPDRALKMLNDPHFDFSVVCDPPRRKYENKWKPRDRRGSHTGSPYPPPFTLRGYLTRRQNGSGYLLR